MSDIENQYGNEKTKVVKMSSSTKHKTKRKRKNKINETDCSEAARFGNIANTEDRIEDRIFDIRN